MRAKFLISLLALLPTLVLCAADKTALLIANSDYGEHPLPEAKANVGKLAKVLEQAGFTVTVKENIEKDLHFRKELETCLLYTSPSPRDRTRSRMPSSA